MADQHQRSALLLPASEVLSEQIETGLVECRLGFVEQ